MGFRHGHILSVYKKARTTPGVEVVGTCETDAATREPLCADGIDVTHTDYAAMLDAVKPDIVAVGDFYARRGAIIIEALRRGCHVISDKPICTSLDEWRQIHALATEGGLQVGCQLDLRDAVKFRTLKRHLQDEQTIGEVHAIGFGGQHPLCYGTRPGWYFEPGKHGGTLNDIAIHAIDLIPWVTGLRFARIEAARNWNANFPQVPDFRDAAQVMLTLDNGAGVLGDVSYLAPTRMGYSSPLYWRLTFWGREGVIETDQSNPGLTLYRDQAEAPETLAADDTVSGGYWHGFLREIDAVDGEICPSTAEVLESSRISLRVQQAADSGETGVSV